MFVDKYFQLYVIAVFKKAFILKMDYVNLYEMTKANFNATESQRSKKNLTRKNRCVYNLIKKHTQ